MLHPLAKKLMSTRKIERKCRFIDKEHVANFIEDLLKIIYPSLGRCLIRDEESLSLAIVKAETSLFEMLLNVVDHEEAHKICESFFLQLQSVIDLLDSDAQTMYTGDPAAKNVEEVVFCYPGFFATYVYRIANLLYKKQVPIFPRLFGEYAHQKTGIDIHPGATIGKNFYIDHGTGVVIGETTIIGNNVKIYQGVTLGAMYVDKSLANSKRHPTIGDNCIIYSNATLLGGETDVGENSIIGGNVWLTKSVPKNTIVYHKSEMKQKPKDD